jgi:hypothetical protein
MLFVDVVACEQKTWRQPERGNVRTTVSDAETCLHQKSGRTFLGDCIEQSLS